MDASVVFKLGWKDDYERFERGYMTNRGWRCLEGDEPESDQGSTYVRGNSACIALGFLTPEL